MENPLFRTKSLNRIASPEALHDYMRVTSPKLWMILSAVVILLAGFIVYATTAKMENVLPIRVEVTSDAADGNETAEDTGTNRYVFCELPMNYADVVKTGMRLRLGGEQGEVSLITASEEDQLVFVVFHMEPGSVPPRDGEYDAELVLESTTPISFLWN